MMSTMTDTQESVTPAFTEWTPCDADPAARALWKMTSEHGTLFFCSHHKNKYEKNLAGWTPNELMYEPSTSE